MKLYAYLEICSYEDQTNELVVTGIFHHAEL